MLPFALLSLLSVVLAVPLQQEEQGSVARKPDCPASPLQPIDEFIGYAPSTLRSAHSFAVAQKSDNIAQQVADSIAPILAQQRTGCRVSIPVQFNNFYVEGSTAREDGYITDAQFATALSTLNANFAQWTTIEFELLRINRIPVTASAWENLEVSSADAVVHSELGTQVKGSSPPVSETRTMHVSIVRDADACGFTYLPVAQWTPSAILRDAVVLDTKCFDGSPQYRSTTFTHEAGHWLGLYHTFEGGCTGQGDFVDDTPPAIAPTDDPDSLYDNCARPPPTSSCGSSNTTEITTSLVNYMSYSVNECRTEFTPGQVERMYAILSLARGYSSCRQG